MAQLLLPLDLPQGGNYSCAMSKIEHDIDGKILHTAWDWGRTSNPDLNHLNRPEDATTEDEHRDAHLMRLTGLDLIRRRMSELLDHDVAAAREFGASTDDLSAALGVTRQAIAKRWPTPGNRVAVVISRRHRVRQSDDGTQYGEVGGTGQYDADRGWFAVGAKVRDAAQYSIIAVDGIVDRTYEIDPTSWITHDGKSQYSAKHGRPMTAAEIDAAGDSLPLRPGDKCGTRAGGSYRPNWF